MPYGSRRMMGILCGLMWVPALAAGVPAGEELSGTYERDGAELVLVQGGNETLVSYASSFPQGASVGTCDCAFVVGAKSGNRWALSGPEARGTWSLRVEPGSLVLEGSGQGCCGAGWSGRDTFKRAALQPLLGCKVKGARVAFHASDAAHTARKAYVVAGDTVEAVQPGSEPELVPARFKGEKVTTAGLLERAQLECGAPRVEAAALEPLKGTWVALTKKGKGYVRTKPCSAETPHFSVDPVTAVMNIEYGQETTRVELTTLAPGAKAGTWTLGVTPGDLPRVRVEWKTTDAAKGLITLSGDPLFTPGSVYVRADKQAAYPVRAETGCDEEGE